MNKLKALFCILIPLGLAFLLNTKINTTPPLLKFLNPFMGFWQNAENNHFMFNHSVKIKGAIDKIEIVFDDRMIPHIFAQNDHDLYLAQGYVTAMHRLWQMDFQTRFAAGRISEVVTSQPARESDRYQRRMGMVYGAENSLKGMMADPKSKEMVLAYTEGINAYIKTLSKAKYPLEYKILDFKPEEWTPLKCALLLKQMSAVLAMGSDEFYMTNILKKFGPEITKNLFPDYPYREDPIIPVGTKWDFKPLPIPATPKAFTDAVTGDVKTKQKIEGIGSNNWALSGSKTASGYPILANDPHLDLSLPSIWYQIQLNAPGVNTYGVSLPGAPGVIIGFNQKIAWGVTNVAADVLDFYQIKFKDSTHNEYWYNNKWTKTSKRIETIKVRGDKDIIDTVYYTHQGPVVYLQKPKFNKANNVPVGNALRWIAHDQSNELLTFYFLNRGKNYDDYRKALTFYTAPAQNFVFASVDNDISITPNGKFPLKWKEQGKYILDGSDPANDWQGWIPASQNPTVKNPPRGFVSSANQSSTDQTYPYYINWEFAPYERGKHINDRLTAMTKATLDSIRLMQTDNYSVMAQNLMPAIMPLVNKDHLNATQKEALSYLTKWNKRYDANEIAASVFEIWTKRLSDDIWSDDFEVAGIPMRYPSRDRTVEMIINEPKSKWYDNTKTSKIETLSDLVNEAFKYSCDSLERRFGPINSDWNWANVKQTHVPHLAKIPGLGSKVLLIGGAKSTINAISETNGPSWRMVIELGKTPKGHGVYPGGQSGNPGSKFYDNMVDTWAQGKLYDLFFMQSPTDASGKIISRLKISK
ncbi:penicillin acylase family protein [Pedobacter changchengzhani]|uniref:Penicillin acylase family protein n=1 Tax=Pedobacter changchengzhani TaxID=2529274 RepID=A0A4R5MNI9_9SPHI|nr:penicillin acylase family protein [Pedobacter changchengzhani]TDG36669.1 penicillin acylase family protein [Pedobacter changchengzhani]